MPECFSAEEIVKNRFLFISYSHVDKVLTEELATFLLNEGVRLWYDKDLSSGDKWSEKVEQLLRHPNCRGVLLICSPDSIISKNAARERAIFLEEQSSRGEDQYFGFIVNVCGENQPISYMQLLKAVFDRQATSSIDDLFPLERLQKFMDIVGPDPICIMTCNADYPQIALNGIKRKAGDTIDKSAVALDAMQKMSYIDGISFSLGRYQINGEPLSLTWQYLYHEGDNGIFLLKQPLEPRLGADLTDWLNGEFCSSAFSAEELQSIEGPLRLLSAKEAENANPKLMRCETPWWLADVSGARQMVVWEDGSVYTGGSINTRIRRGVRPVITLNMNTAKELMQK